LALEFGEITEDMFWDKNGVNVHLRSASWRFPGKRHSYLTGYVSGRMSDPACSKFKTEIECILRSVVRSIAKIDPIDIDDEGEMNMPLRFGKDTMLIKGDTFEDNKVLIKKCLDVYYGISGKNNSIERRIANAVRLLVESDAQSNDAIGLALSVAGIEALLGEQGSEMVEKISTNAATLLEPDLEKRNDAAKYVKNIYDIRSRTLHGSEVEAKSSDRIQARILAAGVFVSMNSYADCMKRSGCEAKNLGELLEGIRDLRFKGGQPVGVIQCPAVRALWTK
jgi:hypothetical protein